MKTRWQRPASALGRLFANARTPLNSLIFCRVCAIESRVSTGVFGEMTKADLVEAVHTKVGFSKRESADIIELLFEIMKGTLERGEKIKISGFGNFEVRDKRARKGRNPQTGESIEISARRVLTFKPSQVLKNVLNGEEPPEDAPPPQP